MLIWFYEVHDFFSELWASCLLLCTLIDVSLYGGSVTARETAETAQTSPPPAQLATAGSASFSAMTETAPVPTSCVTATGTATMAPMRTLCCVVGFISDWF